MKRWAVLILLIGVVTGLAGCSLFTPPPNPQPQLLFEDNFSNTRSPGWWQGNDPPGTWEIKNGHYYGELDDSDSYYYVYNTTVSGLTNFRIQATTSQLGTATDHSWRIILPASDERFYAFEISADGYVVFSVYTPTDWQDIYNWVKSDQIHPAGQTNKLAVEAHGTSFTLYVNDQQVAQVTDATLTSGSVGFIVETWGDPNGGAWFDDLDVWTLVD